MAGFSFRKEVTYHRSGHAYMYELSRYAIKGEYYGTLADFKKNITKMLVRHGGAGLSWNTAAE